MREIKSFVGHINDSLPNVVSRFDFERQTRIVGRSNTDDSANGQFIDPDIHDGTMVSSNGYARLALHKPTGTICLITSKASLNLQGNMQPDGSIIATRKGLESSYITAAYRTSGNTDEIYKIIPKMRRAHRRFNEDLGERSEKHFTLYGTTFKKTPPKGLMSKLFNKKALGPEAEKIEIYTNGRVSYALSYNGKHYRVRFITPTRRKDGSFVPIHVNEGRLTKFFSSVSKTIAKKKDYAEAHHEMKKHWQRLSSKLWDEKSIYEGEGLKMKTQKTVADVANHIIENGLQISIVTLTVGILTGLINPKYGLITGITAAVIHTFMDLVVDEGYTASREAIKRTKEAKRKLNIEAYDFNEDVSDHFKIQTADNINKLCAKMDMQRFKAGDFEFLTSARSRMLLDHEKKLDGFRPSSLRTHLLLVHQRGFSSSCFLPDNATRADEFQSGLVRLLHEKQDGTIVIYAKYRDDLCLDESLRLPEDKRQRMGEKIWRYEYNRNNEDFHHGFRRTHNDISLDDMIKDLGDNLLFKRGDFSKEDQEMALASIREIFDNKSDEDNRSKRLYMGGKPARPPMAIGL